MSGNWFSMIGGDNRTKRVFLNKIPNFISISDPEMLEKQLKAIVGFKMKVQEFQAAYKLSQNRNETDYVNIIDQLKKEEDPNSKQMAEVMEGRLQNHI